ncbi:MAG: hypothetical protein V4578_14270 [Pseudomonadota bacterium]
MPAWPRLRRWLAASCLLLAGAWVAPVWATLQVIYPRIEERPPDDYGFKLLELALKKSGVPFALSMSVPKMNQERARYLLEQGDISVFDAGTSAEFEARFDAVYFPIDRGLSGFRLLLIHKDAQQDFASIQSLDELRRMTAGQGPGWADSKILTTAGIHVRTAEFESLFRMVNARRIDFYPLGADEAYMLLERYRALAPDVVVEPHLVLQYPFSRLFFVRKGDIPLRDAILSGLQKAFADGSLLRFFDQDERFHTSLQRAGLKQRTVIGLDNPYLTPSFRQIPKAYFYAP